MWGPRTIWKGPPPCQDPRPTGRLRAAGRGLEADVLPARLADYDSSWLDSLCQTGRYTWVRLSTGGDVNSRAARTGPIRTSPVAVLPRRRVGLWAGTTGKRKTSHCAFPRRQAAGEYLAKNGASFFDELMDSSGCYGPSWEDALGELVVAGLASSDSFAGLRALLVPPIDAGRSARIAAGDAPRATTSRMLDAGHCSRSAPTRAMTRPRPTRSPSSRWRGRCSPATASRSNGCLNERLPYPRGAT